MIKLEAAIAESNKGGANILTTETLAELEKKTKEIASMVNKLNLNKDAMNGFRKTIDRKDAEIRALAEKLTTVQSISSEVSPSPLRLLGNNLGQKGNSPGPFRIQTIPEEFPDDSNAIGSKSPSVFRQFQLLDIG